MGGGQIWGFPSSFSLLDPLGLGLQTTVYGLQTTGARRAQATIEKVYIEELRRCFFGWWVGERTEIFFDFASAEIEMCEWEGVEVGEKNWGIF